MREQALKVYQEGIEKTRMITACFSIWGLPDGREKVYGGSRRLRNALT